MNYPQLQFKQQQPSNAVLPSGGPSFFIMTPAAAARSLLIADKVMSNNFVSRITFDVWRTNRVSPTVPTLRRWAGLPCGSCALSGPLLFGRRGGASEDLDD